MRHRTAVPPMMIATIIGAAIGPPQALAVYAGAMKAAVTTLSACLGAMILYTVFVAMSPLLGIGPDVRRGVRSPRIRRDGA